VKVSLERNHAIVRSIDVAIEQSDTRYPIVQTERKVRSFRDADGLIRALKMDREVKRKPSYASRLRRATLMGHLCNWFLSLEPTIFA
jgi:hypothetical protein